MKLDTEYDRGRQAAHDAHDANGEEGLTADRRDAIDEGTASPAWLAGFDQGVKDIEQAAAEAAATTLKGLAALPWEEGQEYDIADLVTRLKPEQHQGANAEVYDAVCRILASYTGDGPDVHLI